MEVGQMFGLAFICVTLINFEVPRKSDGKESKGLKEWQNQMEHPKLNKILCVFLGPGSTGNRSPHRPIAPDFCLNKAIGWITDGAPTLLTMIGCFVSQSCLAIDTDIGIGVHLGLRAAIPRSASAVAGKMRSAEPMDGVGIDGRLRGEMFR